MTTQLTTKRGHTLTVAETDEHTTEDPDYDFTVNCLNPPSCTGWQECQEEHEVEGKTAGDPNEADEGDPWANEMEFEFHGVEHTYRYGWGWTVEWPGCVVADNDDAQDSMWDIARDHGAGTYIVDDDWFDETSCSLLFVSKVEA